MKSFVIPDDLTHNCQMAVRKASDKVRFVKSLFTTVEKRLNFRLKVRTATLQSQQYNALLILSSAQIAKIVEKLRSRWHRRPAHVLSNRITLLTNYELRITNYKLQITNYKLQITNHAHRS